MTATVAPIARGGVVPGAFIPLLSILSPCAISFLDTGLQAHLLFRHSQARSREIERVCPAPLRRNDRYSNGPPTGATKLLGSIIIVSKPLERCTKGVAVPLADGQQFEPVPLSALRIGRY
jgi:hypothetical protein